MKRTILLIKLLFIVIYAIGQNAAETSQAELSFESQTFDLGVLSKGIVSEKKIKFTNTGSAPLLLKRIKTTCGCTASDWPKQPILPGNSDFLTVRYNTNAVGKFRKSLIIYSNASSPQTTLTLKVEVRTLTDNSTKSNKTLPLLTQ